MHTQSCHRGWSRHANSRHYRWFHHRDNPRLASVCVCVCERLFIQNYTPNTHTHASIQYLSVFLSQFCIIPGDLCVCMCVWGLQRRLRQDQVSLYKKNQRKSTTIITDRNNMYCNEAMVILII